MKNRLEIAVAFLKEGQSFTVDDLRLEMGADNTFIVYGWSRYLVFKNLSKENSMSEMLGIKSDFSEMLIAYDNLKNLVKDKSVEYKLCYDDSGKTSIDICSEREGIIQWFIDLD